MVAAALSPSTALLADVRASRDRHSVPSTCTSNSIGKRAGLLPRSGTLLSITRAKLSRSCPYLTGMKAIFSPGYNASFLVSRQHCGTASLYISLRRQLLSGNAQHHTRFTSLRMTEG